VYLRNIMFGFRMCCLATRESWEAAEHQWNDFVDLFDLMFDRMFVICNKQ